MMARQGIRNRAAVLGGGEYAVGMAPERPGAAPEKSVAGAKRRSNLPRLVLLGLLAVLAVALYMTVNLRWDNGKLLEYALGLRSGKVAAMLLVAFCIGGASMVFQSVINNTIVTPCLLGMNSLYTLIQTAVVFFFGLGSLVARDQKVAFVVNLAIMGVVATFVYGYLFAKTRYNVLYVLLIGTCLSSFFSSMQSTLMRAMDPNLYDSMLMSLVANFSNFKTEILLLAAAMVVLVPLGLRRELALLDVITLGREQAINLGVDYNRTVKRLLLGVVLYIAIATALVGPISFLGLIIANLARQLLKTYRHSQLILGATLFGVILLIGGQLVVEQVFSYEIPISVFISVGGGLYFLYLLLTQKRRN